jgi:hypothetical protein
LPRACDGILGPLDKFAKERDDLIAPIFTSRVHPPNRQRAVCQGGLALLSWWFIVVQGVVGQTLPDGIQSLPPTENVAPKRHVDSVRSEVRDPPAYYPPGVRLENEPLQEADGNARLATRPVPPLAPTENADPLPTAYYPITPTAADGHSPPPSRPPPRPPLTGQSLLPHVDTSPQEGPSVDLANDGATDQAWPALPRPNTELRGDGSPLGGSAAWRVAQEPAGEPAWQPDARVKTGILPAPGRFPAPPPASDNVVAEPPSAGPGFGRRAFNRCANAPYNPRAFVPDPNYDCLPFDPDAELFTYEGKWCVPAQAPWVELWRGLYRPGPLPPAGTLLTGETNPIIPHFLVFGDYRTAVAINDNGDGQFGVWAHRLNLDFDLKITSTERIHAFWGPLDRGGRFTRAVFRDDNIVLKEELDGDFDTLFFEGDLGYMWGGMTHQWAPFDLPFVAGKFPLLFQNGTWIVDALEGFAFTIPGRHSRILDWPNFEVTFFFGFDDVDSPAFRGDDNVASAYGVNTFIEAYDGYFEIGYAYLDDKTGQGLSYHNLTAAFTRRYFQRVSSSIRAIINTGQDPLAGEQTADGQLLLWENSLITCQPNYFVPYLNMWAGFDRPQSVARAAGAGGILLNTGINFETDALTGFPTLDATANDTWGGAIGINMLGPDFSWQLITELATVQTFGNGGQRFAVANQYGCGLRFQIPISNAWIFRMDGMVGILDESPDVSGTRAELRWKF